MRMFSGLLSIVAVFVWYASANLVYSPEEYKPTFELRRSCTDEIVVGFNLDTLTAVQSFHTKYGKGAEFTVAYDYTLSPEPGTPSIPLLQCFVRIPDKGKIVIEVDTVHTASLGTYDVIPYQSRPPIGAISRIPDTINYKLYSSNKPWPEQEITLGSCEIWRDIRIARILVSPVVYNPVSKEVKIIKQATITLRVTGERGENELNIFDKKFTPSFAPLYNDVLNMDRAMLQGNQQTKPGCYVFLGTRATLDAVRDLINWKIRKGYDVREAVVGSDSIQASLNAIDAWIENAYSTWPNKPEYILIVGNDKAVPPKFITQQMTRHPSDVYYGVIGSGGTTPVPSIHLGRITGDKNQTEDDPAVLKYIAWKTVQHEMAPADNAGRSRCLSWGCHSQQGNDGIGLKIQKEWTGVIEKSMTVVKGTDKNPGQGGEIMDVNKFVSHFNEGVSLVTYIGHGLETKWGNLNFSTTHVKNNINNDVKFPYVLSLACLSGNWTKGYCLYEHMVSEGTVDNPKGAVAVYGYTTTSYENTNGIISNAIENYFDSKIYHMGAAISPAKKYAKTKSDAEGGTVFGCPELDIYTVNPLKTMTVTHGNPLPGDFAVEVIDGNAGVDAALVGVVTDDYVPLASGFTDASGKASLKIDKIPGNADSAYVTVTCHNYKPYTAKVEINPTSLAAQNAGSALYLKISQRNTHQQYQRLFITFTLPRANMPVKLQLYKTNGSIVTSNEYIFEKSGVHTVIFEGSGGKGRRMPSGIYIIRFSCGNETIVRQWCVAQ